MIRIPRWKTIDVTIGRAFCTQGCWRNVSGGTYSPTATGMSGLPGTGAPTTGGPGTGTATGIAAGSGTGAPGSGGTASTGAATGGGTTGAWLPSGGVGLGAGGKAMGLSFQVRRATLHQ